MRSAGFPLSANGRGGGKKAAEPESAAAEGDITMKTCAIVGINWGDEGKGRIVDLLTENYDLVIRYQGGGNAGHTVINDRGKFALHLLPSGIFREGVMNILGNGVALDPENLMKEIREVGDRGVAVTPDNLKISDRHPCSCRGTGTWTRWRSSGWRTGNTVPPNRVSRRFIRTNTRKRR